MPDNELKHQAFKTLRTNLAKYYILSERTWQDLQGICVLRQLEKGQFFLNIGDNPHSFGFVVKGLLRSYITDVKGKDYNKMFFPENTFPGSMTALLTGEESTFAIEALEDTLLIQINFQQYRQLLGMHHDLKWFQILYLEKNWLLEKELIEVALIQLDATERYLKFREKHPALEKRLSQYHIASHLGITPTQLSRIRKSLNN